MPKVNSHNSKVNHQANETKVWDVRRADIAWREIADELFAAKKEPLIAKAIAQCETELANKSNRAKMDELCDRLHCLRDKEYLNEIRKDYRRKEMQVLMSCTRSLGIDLEKCKCGKAYKFTAREAEFILFLLSYDRSRGSYVAKLRHGRTDEITEQEKVKFYGEYMKYAKRKHPKTK